jgi:hypothetical protein
VGTRVPDLLIGSTCNPMHRIVTYVLGAWLCTAKAKPVNKLPSMQSFAVGQKPVSQFVSIIGARPMEGC